MRIPRVGSFSCNDLMKSSSVHVVVSVLDLELSSFLEWNKRCDRELVTSNHKLIYPVV